MSPLERYGPQLGEIAQHEINVDAGIVKTSDWYFDIFDGLLNRFHDAVSVSPTRMLEVACYRHILSYRFARERGFEPTLFDVSDQDLDVGRQIAASERGYPTHFDRVVGEFHNLPFADGHFDLTFVSAALHHTRSPELVIAEMMRVTRDGGYFYCQREPVERLFCFYKFPGNRAYAHTGFEKHLVERDLTRTICSPFPGARNAIVFGRIENDRISLDKWFAAFAPFGKIVEEVLYHEGLLTSLDKEVLAREGTSEAEIAEFIRRRLTQEVDIASQKQTDQDRLLGHILPSTVEIDEKARQVASALKARDKRRESPEWRRQMARIFGASIRILVRRKNGEQRNDEKFRRHLSSRGCVLLDNSAYDGLLFWDRLMPDLAKVDLSTLRTFFPERDWVIANEKPGLRVMGSLRGNADLFPNLHSPAVLALRYSVIVDQKLPVVRILMTYKGETVVDEVVAQSEDRVAKISCDDAAAPVGMHLLALDGTPIDLPMRIRVSVAQAVPLTN